MSELRFEKDLDEKAKKQIIKKMEEIRSLKVQGARNVAKATVEIFLTYLKNKDSSSVISLVEDSVRFALNIIELRPTEPMTRNIMKEVIVFMLSLVSKAKTVEELKELTEKKLTERYFDSIKRVAEIGANFIPPSSTIFTHCHSSTVTSIIKKAFDMGKNIRVIASETRPRFQGRITAKELVEYGVEVTFIVDSAMARFVKKADLVLVGADAITYGGDLINKIGTLSLAIIARYNNVPFFSAAESYKYDPSTLFGFKEVIEERPSKEVWDFSHKLLKIMNPAFDEVPSKLIDKYITEVGVVNPTQLSLLKEEDNG